MSFLFLALLILGLLYIIVLPLYRKRPIVLTEKKLLSIVFFAFGFAIFSWQTFWILWVSILVLMFLLLYFVSFWVTLGIEKVDLNTALQKAISGTLTKSETSALGIKLLEPTGEIKMRSIFQNLIIVTFNLASKSAKQKLVKTVFQKFIDNYFFKI